MNHDEKVKAALRVLKTRGVSEWTTAPPIFRILWSCGLKTPPPLFLGFVTLALSFSVFFGAFWGAIMWSIGLRPLSDSMPFWVPSGLAGITFGAIMAFRFRWKSRRLNLPSWDQFDGK